MTERLVNLERVSEELLARYWTYRELDEAAGLGVGMTSAIFRRKGRASPATVGKIAVALGLGPDEIWAHSESTEVEG